MVRHFLSDLRSVTFGSSLSSRAKMRVTTATVLLPMLLTSFSALLFFFYESHDCHCALANAVDIFLRAPLVGLVSNN